MGLMELYQSIIQPLAERFDAQIFEYGGEVSLVVKPEQFVQLAKALHDEQGFKLLVEETAVDYWPAQEPRFHIVCRVRRPTTDLIVGIRTPLDGNRPSLPSLVPVYANANWFERELWDMFGIHFDGHPDLRRLIMPHDWQGHPLRKDFPLGYEEVQFTFNFDEIDRRKPYAKE
jgi:NADH-quinone oxidoreductase subunit C